jgi:LmbE family N-acetylglucosaminyl deacetylase
VNGCATTSTPIVRSRLVGDSRDVSRRHARPVLVVFPHPDDEVFFSATLRRLSQSGNALHLIYVTSGGLAPGGQRLRWLGRSLTAADVGLAGAEVLGFEDGWCVAQMCEIRDKLRAHMFRLRPSSVFTVAYEGGHADHDACHWAVVAAAGSSPGSPAVYEFPTYHRGGRLFAAGVLLPDDGEVCRTRVGNGDLRRKAAILRCHGVHGALLRCFLQLFLDRDELLRGEPYRRVPLRSYLDPPHLGRLGYELYTRWTFHAFRSMVRRCEG